MFLSLLQVFLYSVLVYRFEIFFCIYRLTVIHNGETQTTASTLMSIAACCWWKWIVWVVLLWSSCLLPNRSLKARRRAWQKAMMDSSTTTVPGLQKAHKLHHGARPYAQINTPVIIIIIITHKAFRNKSHTWYLPRSKTGTKKKQKQRKQSTVNY